MRVEGKPEILFEARCEQRVIILDVENISMTIGQKKTSNLNNKIQAKNIVVFNNYLFRFL